jgi:hypothetical protein
MSTLSTNYDDDWKHVDGIQDAGYEFGDAREFPDGEEQTAPSEGVKVRVTNPTQNEIVVAAATIGYESRDMIITIWSRTLCSGEERIEPADGDWIIFCDGKRWRIRSWKMCVDGAQYRCMCRKSVKLPSR